MTYDPSLSQGVPRQRLNDSILPDLVLPSYAILNCIPQSTPYKLVEPYSQDPIKQTNTLVLSYYFSEEPS